MRAVIRRVRRSLLVRTRKQSVGVGNHDSHRFNRFNLPGSHPTTEGFETASMGNTIITRLEKSGGPSRTSGPFSFYLAAANCWSLSNFRLGHLRWVFPSNLCPSFSG